MLVLEGFGGGTEARSRVPEHLSWPQLPPLSSEEIDLSGGSASAGGADVITTTTSAKNANAITTDTINPGERSKVGFGLVHQ